MTLVIVIVVAVVMLAVGLGAGYWLPPNGRRPKRAAPPPVRRILLPFTGNANSRRSFEAAVRLAHAENASIMPAFLARVPRYLPLDAPLPGACTEGMPLLEAIEQSAAAQGVAVDARVARGRTYRDALSRLLDQERFDRIIISATENTNAGLSANDLEWLLERVPAEIMILRPGPDDTRRISANGLAGHF